MTDNTHTPDAEQHADSHAHSNEGQDSPGTETDGGGTTDPTGTRADEPPETRPDDATQARSTDPTGPRPVDPLDEVLPKAYWVGIGLSALVAALALERFYAHATAAIRRLVTPEYADLFLAGFNLALVLLAALAASLLVRRLVDHRATA